MIGRLYQQGVREAVAMLPASTDEAERLLEDLIVREPNLLGRGMALVGRQLPTAGGPLDVLGVDQDGRLVVFELKRGVLTREAVAQVLDYASDLAEQGEEHLARLIETNSGRNRPIVATAQNDPGARHEKSWASMGTEITGL
jgi:hypothetical protein